MPALTAYENTMAYRWDAGLSDDSDDTADAEEFAVSLRARALIDAA